MTVAFSVYVCVPFEREFLITIFPHTGLHKCTVSTEFFWDYIIRFVFLGMGKENTECLSPPFTEVIERKSPWEKECLKSA